MDGKSLRQLGLLAEDLPPTIAALAEIEERCATMREGLMVLSEHLQHVAAAGVVEALPVDLYVVVENGKRNTANEDEIEGLRQNWTGTFLLDLSQRTLRIRRGKTVDELRLGTRDLHWGDSRGSTVAVNERLPRMSFFPESSENECAFGQLKR